MGTGTLSKATESKTESKTASKVEVRLFGPPSLAVDGETQPLPDKAFVLLAILAASERKSASRSQIRAILWGDFDREKANANLRQLIARVSKIQQKFGFILLEVTGDIVALNAAGCIVDEAGFLSLQESGGQESGAGSVPTDKRCETLLRLWSGPLLDGIGFDEPAVDEWLESNREQIRHRFVDAARQALATIADPAAADAAWRLALKVIEVDSSEEAAYRAMMRICAARGDRGLALRIFGRCKRILATELGVQPSKETLDLAATLRHRAPGAQNSAQVQLASTLSSHAELRQDGIVGGLRQIPVVMIVPPISVVVDESTRMLALGFVEDITIGLTRFRRFSVVAPHSSVAIACESQSLEDAMTVLDVDYAVATSLMPGVHGFRFAVRLTDMSNAQVLWATDTDFTLATLGGTFERVIGLVVRSLVDTIDNYQMRTPIPANDATAYRHYLEGRRLLHRTDLQAIRRARRMFKNALDQVADYPAAVVGLSRTMSEEWLVRGMVETDLLEDSVALANKAAALDPFDGRAMRELGCATLYMRRHDESLQAFEEALRLNPHDADILADYADALAHSGDPQQGLAYCLKAIELNPMPPDDYVWTLGSIYYQLGDYRAALDALRQVENSPATARLLAACAAQLGETELARRYSRVVRSVYPGFQVERVRTIVPNRNPADTEHLIDGLKRAGLA